MNPNQIPSYETAGFNQFMERNPQTFMANEQLDSYTSPFISQVVNNGLLFDPFSDFSSQTIQSLLQPVSADNVQGGVLQSNNGNLTIDLNNGTLNYSDGAANLFNLGGTNTTGTQNSLTAQNAQGQTILSSDQTQTVQPVTLNSIVG